MWNMTKLAKRRKSAGISNTDLNKGFVSVYGLLPLGLRFSNLFVSYQPTTSILEGVVMSSQNDTLSWPVVPDPFNAYEAAFLYPTNVEETPYIEPSEEPIPRPVEPGLVVQPAVEPEPAITGTRYNRGNLRAEILELFERELGWTHDKEFHLGEAVRAKNASYGVRNSNHHRGNAVDLTPRGTMTFDQMKRAIVDNPNIRRFFAENKLGILDERTKRGSWVSTGPHFHIGPDSGAILDWSRWLRELGFSIR